MRNGETVITKQRQELLDGLQRLGGKLVVSPGQHRLSPDEVRVKLNLTGSRNVTQLLARAEEDGLIKREIRGKYTKGIYLVHGRRGPKPRDLAALSVGTPARNGNGHTNGNGNGNGAPVAMYSNGKSRPRQHLPLPQIGEQVVVAMVSLDREGHIQIGLRNDEGSWLATVDSYAAAPDSSEAE